MTGSQPTQPPAAAQKGLTEWHRIVAESDWDALPDLVVDDVVFRNPAAFEPHHGKPTITAVLPVVFSVMEDFTYLREYGRETGYALEFSARVGADPVLGVDLIEFDQHGKITDFMVMMRPAGAVLALAAEAAERLAGS